MALVISETTVESEAAPDHSEALQKILRRFEERAKRQEKLQQSASAWIRILEEQRRLQHLVTPYQAIQAQILRTHPAQDQAIQALDVVERERARLLTPIDPDWQYRAGRAFLQRELQYDPTQGLISSLSQWEALQRQLFGPWPLVGPWRDAETLRWLLWAFQEGDSDDYEAAVSQLAGMIRRPRLSQEARWQLHHRSRLMGMTGDEYWRRVVLPQAFLLVRAAMKVPRRIQLGGNGQGRVLDAQGRWTPQAPVDKLSEELLASYLFDEIPKAAICILTDQEYPKPSNDLWHAGPIERKDDQGTVERVPRVVRLQTGERDLTPTHGDICGPSPEMMAILALDLQKLWRNASAQQRQILERLLTGCTIQEVASELHITAQAVHGQLKRLQHKYQAG